MNDTEARKTDCLQSSFRATQSESDEVANNLHCTSLELAEIKSEQVLATDANKKAETDTTAEWTIVFAASDNSEDRASVLHPIVFLQKLC